MKSENQERRERELWRFEDRIEREKVKERVPFFFVFIPTGVGLHYLFSFLLYLLLFVFYLDAFKVKVIVS